MRNWLLRGISLLMAMVLLAETGGLSKAEARRRSHISRWISTK